MEKIVEYIHKNLESLGIEQKYTSELNDMTENHIISGNMPLKGAYNAFLLRMSRVHPIFSRILKKEYIFDITFTITKNISNLQEFKEKLSKKTPEFEYFFILNEDNGLSIGAKFSDNIYDIEENFKGLVYIKPYKFLCDYFELDMADFEFKQYIFPINGNNDVQKAYSSFIELLKTVNIPLSIVSDDILFKDTNILNLYDVCIYLEQSRKWPKDQNAINCAKTAFYCQLCSKICCRVFIDKNYCVFNHRGFFFKVRIFIKSDLNVKHRVILGLNSKIKEKGQGFHRKVKMIKGLLANLGFYPLIFDDLLIDSISLILGSNIIADAKFIDEFFKFNFDLCNKTFNLDDLQYEPSYSINTNSKNLKISWKNETLAVSLPSSYYIEQLREIFSSFNSNAFKISNSSDSFFISPDPFSKPILDSFSFILAKNKLDDRFDEIIGAMEGPFDLAVPEYRDSPIKIMPNKIKTYYSPTLGLLMVKVDEDLDSNLIANIFISETSFNFIRFN